MAHMLGKQVDLAYHRFALAPKAQMLLARFIIIIIIKIYHDFLPPPRRGSHVKPDNIHTQSSRYTP